MRWGRKKEKLGDKGAPFHVLLARVFGSATHFMIAVTPRIKRMSSVSGPEHSHPREWLWD